jgi:hypothetical protein
MQYISKLLARARMTILQFVFAIVLIICLGVLGTFPLVARLFPSQQAAVTKGLIPTGPFTESECTATPAGMKYLPSSQHQAASAPLSQAWAQAGRSQKDFANAQACAATFVNTYETFDSTDSGTFTHCTPMLTDGAIRRFYGTAAGAQPDQHMDPMWQASLRQQSYKQTAQASAPTLLNATYTDGRMLVWMLVSYHTEIQTGSNKAIIQNTQSTVLLLGVPVNQDKTGTGWQVSDWAEGNTHLDVPSPL